MKQRSEESRKRYSESVKKLWQDPQYRQHMSDVHKGKSTWKGRRHSEESRRKMSVAQVGRHPSDITRKRMSEALTGRPVSEATRRKISEKKVGVPHPYRQSLELQRARREAFSGPRNPNWNGGTSFAPYSVDWTETLKRSIRERDHYACRMCGAPQGGIAFPVHHVDYNKKNSTPSNLITLCVGCHGKTVKHREHWSAYLQRLLLGGADTTEESL